MSAATRNSAVDKSSTAVMIQRGQSSCGIEFYFQQIHMFNCYYQCQHTDVTHRAPKQQVSELPGCVCVLQVRYHSDISFTSPCPFDFLCIALPGKLTYSFFYFFFLDPVAFIFLVPFVPLSEIEQKKAHAAELWMTGASKVTNLSGVTSVMERHVMDPVLS